MADEQLEEARRIAEERAEAFKKGRVEVNDPRAEGFRRGRVETNRPNSRISRRK
jgi:hypothetical protein